MGGFCRFFKIKVLPLIGVANCSYTLVVVAVHLFLDQKEKIFYFALKHAV